MKQEQDRTEQKTGLQNQTEYSAINKEVGLTCSESVERSRNTSVSS